MKRILSFGGGLQTTALAIMIAKGELEVDEVVFADTGAEKPETYWYIENYIKPLLKEANLTLTIVRNHLASYSFGDMYAHFWRLKTIPSPIQRRCTDHFKLRPIAKEVPKESEVLIGFSLDEAYRGNRKRSRWAKESYPLIERGLTSQDCRNIISDYGFPRPLKSSCYICPFQKVPEWNWLKNTHNDLFQKAIDLEYRYHQRFTQFKNNFGLLGGTPLWKMAQGLQPEMFQLEERACWSGHCGH